MHINCTSTSYHSHEHNTLTVRPLHPLYWQIPLPPFPAVLGATNHQMSGHNLHFRQRLHRQENYFLISTWVLSKHSIWCLWIAVNSKSEFRLLHTFREVYRVYSAWHTPLSCTAGRRHLWGFSDFSKLSVWALKEVFAWISCGLTIFLPLSVLFFMFALALKWDTLRVDDYFQTQQHLAKHQIR